MTQRGAELGRSFETRVAKKMGGTRYPGVDGDVDARGYRIECKYQEGLGRLPILRGWLDQIQRYEKRHPGLIVPLAFTGGKTYQNGRTWIAVDIDHFRYLTDPGNLPAILQELTRIREILEKQDT